MPTYGSSATSGMGIAGSGQLRGSVYGVWPDNAWVTSISARLGRAPSGSNSTARMGLYTTANTHPNTLVGQTAAFTVSAAMDHGAGGQVYTQSFSGGALRVSAGGNYAIGIVGTGGALYHAMVPAVNSPFTNKNFYYRSGVTGSLPSTFGYTSSSYEGNISAYVTYTTNRAPTSATSAPNGLITTSSVTFRGNFSDPDSSLGDKMLRFHYEVQTSGGAAVYNSGWVAANATEANNNQFSRARTLSAGNYRWRCRVQDQFGVASGYTAWRTFQVHLNRAPTAATVVPDGLQTSTTVNFQGSFTDPDTSITGDVLSRFRFQIINDTSKGLVHDSGELTANSTEQTNKRFSRNVALSAGVPYAWRTQVRDNLGAWSAWTGYRTFTINAGGAVDTLGGVSGKQNSRQPTPFTSVWRHANGLNANMFQFRILQSGTQIRLGNEISTSTANNGALNSDWSTAFGTYSLPWGSKNLTWQVRARDTAGVVSNWSTERAFFINSAPSPPTNLSPTNSAASPLRPLLQCRAVDDDGDPVTVKARIKTRAGTVLHTRTMVRVGDWYQYQTSAADLPSYDTYTWDAYSYDGILYSGETTTEASAQKSASSTFIYAPVPNVVLTSPIENQEYAGSVDITWNSIPNQQARRILVEDIESGQQLTDGVWLNSTQTSVNLTASQLGFRKGRSYSVVVELRDTNGLEGSSDPITFIIDYDAPVPVDQFVSTPVMVGNDTYPTGIHLTWEAYLVEGFQRYTISRICRDETQPLVLAVITNPDETSFTDLIPPTGIDMEYSIVVTTMQGIDETESEPAFTTTQINLESVILQNIYQSNQRIALVLDSDRGYSYVDDVVLEIPWGAHAPVAIHSPVNYQVFSGSFTLLSDEYNSAKILLQTLQSMYRSKQTICYRDERDRRIFGTITSFSVTDERIDQYTVDIQITETSYEEGVPV